MQLFTPWQHLFAEARSSECTNLVIHQPTTAQSYSDFTNSYYDTRVVVLLGAQLQLVQFEK